jgi:glucose-6-phosphate isomerase
MINWKNLDTLNSYGNLSEVDKVKLSEVMSADRVKSYSTPMAEGLTYNYAAKQVNDKVLDALAKLAKEAQLTEKFEALYNGEVVNTGEKRLVLHHMTRGQLGDAVNADGVDKRSFYVEQQNRIAEFANKVHNGEITNAAGEKFTTVVQIGIGGSDLGPRAMYIALENWAKKNGAFRMEAKFISNVDPDDAAAVLASTDVAHSIFVLGYPNTFLSYTPIRASSISGFFRISSFLDSLSSAAAPSKNCANTSGPKASDNTAPPTAEVEEKRPPI